MEALQIPQEEYCPNCGSWVFFAHFNHVTGWCVACSLNSPEIEHVCTACGGVCDKGRSTCRTCRREQWLEQHEDDIELLVVTKNYSVSYARQVVADLTRPLCYCCGRPIKGGNQKSLFCKFDKRCHSMYNRYRRLVNKGKTEIEALREVIQ